MTQEKKQLEFLKHFDSFQKDCETYRRLEVIKNNYERMLKLIWGEKENFRIYSIHFSARGDIEPFTVNPHRTIPWRYIYDGLEAALKPVIEEMRKIEEQYELKESEYKKEQKPEVLAESSCCGDNRFEIIEEAKKDILEKTNIGTSKDEMEVLDSVLFRCWQMGWLEKYEVRKEE